MSTLSSLPAPHPGGGVQPKPEPPGPAVTLRIAPPKQPPEKRRTALWATLLTVALLAAGTAYYLNTHSRKKVSGGGPPIVTVSTAVVGMGDLQSTVRWMAPWRRATSRRCWRRALLAAGRASTAAAIRVAAAVAWVTSAWCS